MAKRTLQLQVSDNFLRLGNINQALIKRLMTKLEKKFLERRKQLIFLQFIDYPGESNTKVINRSGKFLKSLRHKITRSGKLGFSVDTLYNGKYQTVQPSDGRRSITIRAKNKKFLTIPNPKNKELFNAKGRYIYDGVPLYEDGEPNPAHPLSEELFFRPKKKKRGESNKTFRLVDISGKIFYYLKKSVTIKTKRPITKADQKLLKESQGLINETLQETLAEFFDLKESTKPKTKRIDQSIKRIKPKN